MAESKSATGVAVRQRHKNEATRKRILILDPDKAKPNSEAWHFLRRLSGKCGRMCIEVADRKIVISEDLCAVCLTSAKQCPGGAIKIVRLPARLSSDTITYKYGPNAFQLHGLPMPRRGHVLGLLGRNGTGKSTAVNMLAGRLKPNLGFDSWSECASPPAWKDVVKYFRGSDLQNYFTSLAEDRLSIAVKAQLNPSRIIARLGDERVGDVLRERAERGNLDEMVDKLELSHLLDRCVRELSGGELQRLAVCTAVVRNADTYLFDETSSFLDVRQRLAASDVIRGLIESETYRREGYELGEAQRIASSRYVLVVEHDITILDYASDYVCVIYGEPGAYGVVAQRSTAARGINNFLSGYLPSENVRFRDEEITFHISAQELDVTAGVTDDTEGEVGKKMRPLTAVGESGSDGFYTYSAATRTLCSSVYSASGKPQATSFTLHVEAGKFRSGQVIGLLGENGSGKTTFLEMLVGSTSAASSVKGSLALSRTDSLALHGISYKQQHVNMDKRIRKFDGSVQQFLEAHVQRGLGDRMFRLLVMKPLQIDQMEKLIVKNLSGGEMQRLAICACLSASAGLYLIDEPSAGLDCETRLVVARVIKRWVVSHLGATAFVIEHDMVMASALFDQIVLFSGEPGVECTALKPVSPSEGFNVFLRNLGITFRRVRDNFRPRINRKGTRRDREQKAAGNYYSIETADDS